MTNTLLTAKQIANDALAHLYDNVVLANLVHKDFSSEFVAGKGATVDIRKPATFEAKKFDPATGIQIQDAVEDKVSVTLDTHLDVSFAVSSMDLSLNVTDFSTQFLAPAMEAIVQGIEIELMTLRDDVTNVIVGDSTDPKILAKAGASLTGNKVPLTERYSVNGAGTYAEWITKPPFDKADSAGSTSALREASLGRAYGFDTYQATRFTEALQADEQNLVFHKTAFALVTRSLELPKGASNAYIANFGGFGLRVVMDYDVSKKRDVVSIDTLIGVKTIDAARAAIIGG